MRSHTWTCPRIVVAALAFAIGGCQSMRGPSEPGGQYPVVPEVAAKANGAIYQEGRSSAALFDNATARHVGDLLTIRLEESTSATKSATTSTKKGTSVTIPSPTVFGRPVTHNGVPILETAVTGNSAFDGKGASAQSNQLTGSITVTVVGRVGNGNLLVRGQKWLMLNQGRELIRVEGLVRTIDVEPDNSVSSLKLADAKISYGGRGALADSNSMGWLARFFNSPLMPF